MSNDPYRDDPYGLGDPPPSGGTPEASWMPPSDRPEAGPEPRPAPPPAWTQPPGTSPTGAPPGQPEPPPQYQAPQYHAPQYQAPQNLAQPPQYPGARRPTNGLAIAALVCSLAGVVTLVSAPVGAVLGHLATRQIAQTGEEGASLAKAAIWVGWIITGLIVAACCAVLALAIAASRTTDFAPR